MDAEAARILIAEHLAVGIHTVRDDAHLCEDLGADSLDLIELAMRFEEALDIPVADEESDLCVTVSDVIALVEQKVALKRAA